MKLNDWIQKIFSRPHGSSRRRQQYRRSSRSQLSAEVLEERTLLAAEISIASVGAATEGQNALFSVTLSEVTSATVTVEYSTADSDGPSPASGGVDYTERLNQTLTFSPGQTSKTISIPTTNDSQSELPETFDVVLSNASGAPIVVNSASGTINDNDGTLRTVSVADASPVTEGQNASFVVSLSAAATSAVSVRYSTGSGTGPDAATDGVDITSAADQTLTFRPGETQKTITVATLDDQTAELDELFTVSLSSPVGVTIADREASGEILDNDSVASLPLLSISDAPAVTEGGDAVFTVTLTSAAASAVNVKYSTYLDNRPTAANGSDFTAIDQKTLTFAAGETRKTISVSTDDDSVVEDAETFGVRLTEPSGATLATSEAIGTINDNEVSLPAFSINNAAPVVEGNNATFTVTLDRAATRVLTVDYSTASGFGPSVATADVDYTSVSDRTLSFGIGETQKTITIVTADDNEIESTEEFQVDLSSASAGSRIASGQGRGTINDNDNNATAGFSVSKSSVSVNETGTTATFSVVLSTAPSSNVAFTIDGSDNGEATVSPAALVFTSANWNTPQQVTVTGVDDVLVDGNQTSTITVAVNDGASDNVFDSLPDQTVAVTTVNDDVAEGFQILSPLGAIDYQRPTFSWTQIPDAVSYDFELILAGGSANPVIQTTTNGTSIVSPLALQIGQYRTWVRATLSDGTKTSWMSDVFRVTATTTIHEIGFHGTDRTPTFSWDAVEGATQYRVFLSNRTTGGAAVVDQLVGGTSFTPTSNLNFGRYLLWVRPIGLNGYESAWSVSEDYYVGPTLLGPTGSITNSQPQFTWTAISGAATYHLFVSGPGGVLINEPTLTGTSFNAPTALPDGDFRWWIKPATADGGSGAWSLPQFFSTGGRTRVTSHSGTISTSIPEFSWPAVPGVQSYEVYVSKTGTSGALFRQAGITSTSFSSQALDNGEYKVWIRSVQSDGTAVWGSGVSFTVDKINTSLTTSPLSPTAPGFDTTPQFSWSATSAATGYDIYLHNGSGGFLQSNLSGTTWTPTAPLASGDWTWKIRPRSSNGETGSWSASNAFSTSGRTILFSPGGSTSDRTPTFSWQGVSGANRYVLQVDNLTTGSSKVVREDNLTGTAFTSASPLAAGTYRAWVRAVSNSTVAPWSVEVDFVVS